VITLHQGDCLEVLRGLADASVSAIVTDPPYALTSAQGKGFMGKAWDGALPGVEVWAECLRVARPGAHLLAFGGTRTHHRLMCAIEDAGWEIRDCLMWVYGSGFPKSLNVSAAIDKAAGAEREVIGNKRISPTRPEHGKFNDDNYEWKWDVPITAPATDAARQWAGWGTALKPAWEIIVLARKPLDGTVAANVLAHGTGALNIDATRVNPGDLVSGGGGFKGGAGTRHEGWNRPSHREGEPTYAHNLGRFPPNFLLTHHPDCNGSCVDQCPVRGLDAQAGERPSGGRPGVAYARRPSARKCYGPGLEGQTSIEYADSGPVSRFYPTFAWEADDFAPFLYCPKASRAERGEGNTHPCVKPLQLMRWLVRLVCPPGGLLLDPFCGSGTTLLAADAEGFDAIGCDDDPESVAIARRRLDAARAGTPLFTS
jgi:DNA modification methylase